MRFERRMQFEADVLRNRMVVIILEVFGGTFKKEGHAREKQRLGYIDDEPSAKLRVVGKVFQDWHRRTSHTRKLNGFEPGLFFPGWNVKVVFDA